MTSGLDAGAALFDNLRATAERRGDAPALTFLDARLAPTSYTYRALYERSAGLADALAAHVPKSALLGILLPTQEAQVLHYLAALRLGCVPAILTPPNRKLNRDYFLRSLQFTMRTCGLSAVVAGPEWADLPVTVLEPYTFREVRREAAVGEGEGPGCVPEDVAFVQFSSGTTGLKRGVRISHRASLAQLATYAAALELTSNDCVLSWLPLYHDMGFIACLHLPLAFGAHCVMLEPLDWVASPVSYLRAATTYHATLGWCPNFAYAFMADRARPQDLLGLDLSSLRGLVNCSEPVTHESQARFLERFGGCGLRRDVFLGCYAMAETVFALTHGRCTDDGALDHQGAAMGAPFGGVLPLVSAGCPLPGVSLQVRDESGEPVPDRRLGELWVRAPFLFDGYHNNPEATAAAFAGGWYKTGDHGYKVGDNVFVCGRTKDMMIVGGVNVFPQDVEEVASGTPGVRPGRAAAFSEFDPQAQTERIVVLAESDVPPEEEAGLLVRVRQRILAVFQVANFEAHLVPPGWLLKSSSGKMARRANQARWAALGGLAGALNQVG